MQRHAESNPRSIPIANVFRQHFWWGAALLLLVLFPAALRAGTPHPSKASADANQPHPEVTIPVTPLGYLPPGELPAFYNYALVNLRFLDANHLVFVFNIPGLLDRDNSCSVSDNERMVRAVVLELPSGRTLNRAEWKLYDFGDFLWSLGNGQLLLRRCTQLDLLGADLRPRPWIKVAGEIQDLNFSPDRSIAVVEEKTEPSSGAKDSGTVPAITEQATSAARTLVTFVQIHPLRGIARAEIPLPAAVPVTDQGILETLTAPKNQWVVNLQPFHGPQRPIGSIHSLCSPAIRPITNDLFVATVCAKRDENVFQGYDRKGLLLWQIPFPSDHLSPTLILVPNGGHFAIESLHLKHPHAPLDPVSKEDVEGQDIDIYDTLTGVRVATFQTTPVYTGGRNVDFSPDGSRMAVLHNGVIEIYALSELEKAYRNPSR
ncbi:MAG: hypothetical protein ACRD28_00375 [Acidobacteriaceae bacterium]